MGRTGIMVHAFYGCGKGRVSGGRVFARSRPYIWRVWIPAFAGMTEGGGTDGWWREFCSPWPTETVGGGNSPQEGLCIGPGQWGKLQNYCREKRMQAQDGVRWEQ